MMVLVDKTLLVKSEGKDRIRVTRYKTGSDDKSVTCRATVNDLVRSLVQVEATYPEIVRALHEAKQKDNLRSRLAFDATPKTGRTFNR